ncbi:MAG: FixH family protein [Sulfurimonadaceae bacterium]
MSKESQGKIWPYAIVISILLIVAASVMTVIIALDHPVEMSDSNMQDYHHYDKNANEFIQAKIAFDKKYKITYASEMLDLNGAVVAYKVTDTSGASVNRAKLDIVLTRPDNQDSDIILDNPTVENGLYTFEAGKLPLEGRWNIMAHVIVDENERYYNLKADTRYPKAFEY